MNDLEFERSDTRMTPDGVLFVRKSLLERVERELAKAERELAELRERTRWVPVSERLPDQSHPWVLITNPITGISPASFDGVDFWYDDERAVLFDPYRPTHWMPLPEPPEDA